MRGLRQACADAGGTMMTAARPLKAPARASGRRAHPRRPAGGLSVESLRGRRPRPRIKARTAAGPWGLTAAGDSDGGERAGHGKNLKPARSTRMRGGARPRD